MIRAYLKNIHANKIIFLAFSILLTIVSTVYYFYADGYNEWRNFLISTSEYSQMGVPLEFFYYIQTSAQTIWFSFITFIAVTNIFSVDRVINKKSGFCNMMKTRIGHSKYIRNELLANTIFSLLYIFILQIVLLITIRILVGPFDFSSMRSLDFVSYTNIYSDSPLISLIVYLTFSIIGYTLYSNFLFTLGFYINNVYVYRGIGLIISILLIVLPAVVFVTLYRMFNLTYLLDIGSLIFLPNLLNPGIQLLEAVHMILGSPYLNFLFASIFMIIITLLLFFHGSKKEYRYE